MSPQWNDDMGYTWRSNQTNCSNLPSLTIRIIYFERITVGLIDLIIAEVLFDWSISETILHSKGLDKFDFIFNYCLNEIPLSLQPMRFTSLIRN